MARSPISMIGWFGAFSVRRVKRGANFLNGASRYFSQRPSGSIVCRSLSITRNPLLAIALSLLPPLARRAARLTETGG